MSSYAELHCWSNFTFLEGGSHPEELVSQAAALGLHALALTDRDGLYGIVRFAKTAKAALNADGYFADQSSDEDGFERTAARCRARAKAVRLRLVHTASAV